MPVAAEGASLSLGFLDGGAAVGTFKEGSSRSESLRLREEPEGELEMPKFSLRGDRGSFLGLGPLVA